VAARDENCRMKNFITYALRLILPSKLPQAVILLTFISEVLTLNFSHGHSLLTEYVPLSTLGFPRGME
jgi:hypothetical protein